MLKTNGSRKALLAAALAASLGFPAIAVAWEANTFAMSDGDIAFEAKEAKAAGKRVALVFHMAGCPSCVSLEAHLEKTPGLLVKLRERYVLVGVDVRGSLDITAPGGVAMTEADYAKSLGVFASPTVIFLDENGRPAARAVGYEASKMLWASVAEGPSKKEGRRDVRKNNS